MTIPNIEILEHFFNGWSIARLCEHYALSREVVEALIRKAGLDRPKSHYAEYVTYPCRTHMSGTPIKRESRTSPPFE